MKLTILAALVVLASPGASEAAGTYFLVKTWLQNGNMMCEYSNGTVLNIGVGPCPQSI